MFSVFRHLVSKSDLRRPSGPHLYENQVATYHQINCWCGQDSHFSVRGEL
jgi:hypothetical protein